MVVNSPRVFTLAFIYKGKRSMIVGKKRLYLAKWPELPENGVSARVAPWQGSSLTRARFPRRNFEQFSIVRTS